jgi:RimJ/RimL family protein N-acetyltransferase
MHNMSLPDNARSQASSPQGAPPVPCLDPAEGPTTRLLIAQLGPAHRKRIAAHLLSLPADDRRLRFGFLISDSSLLEYVRTVRFNKDAAFGGFDEEGRLCAFAHLAFDADQHSAELGLSVAPEARRRGAGLALLDRAAAHARNRGRNSIVLVYVPENVALASLARRAGMQVTHDPVEPRAYLSLEPATPASVLHEAVGEAIAAIDLGFRVGNTTLPTSA